MCPSKMSLSRQVSFGLAYNFTASKCSPVGHNAFFSNCIDLNTADNVAN